MKKEEQLKRENRMQQQNKNIVILRKGNKNKEKNRG